MHPMTISIKHFYSSSECMTIQRSQGVGNVHRWFPSHLYKAIAGFKAYRSDGLRNHENLTTALGTLGTISIQCSFSTQQQLPKVSEGLYSIFTQDITLHRSYLTEMSQVQNYIKAVSIKRKFSSLIFHQIDAFWQGSVFRYAFVQKVNLKGHQNHNMIK